MNDYALVGGRVDHIAKDIVPNASWVDEDVFYTRLNRCCRKIKGDDSVGFLDIIYSIVSKWGVFCDVLRTWEWHFWFGFGSGIR